MSIAVFGLISPTVLLEDIQMDVPFETTVVIPSEQAMRSKDLWRAISSKQVYQLSKSPNAVPYPTQEQELRTRIRELEQENEDLRSRLLAKHAECDKYSVQQTMLETILQKLTVPHTLPLTVAATQAAPVTVDMGAVAGDVPMFIPSNITPEVVETRIETTKSETETPVSDAQSKLREMRRKK